MSDWLRQLIEHIKHKRPGASPEALQRLKKYLNGVPVPVDYFEFMELVDGIDDFLGETYVVVYPVEETIGTVRVETGRYAPGLVVFGGNGSGDYFGFDSRKRPIEVVFMPGIGMDWRMARPLGTSFEEFLENALTGRLYA